MNMSLRLLYIYSYDSSIEVNGQLTCYLMVLKYHTSFWRPWLSIIWK